MVDEELETKADMTPGKLRWPNVWMVGMVAIHASW